MQPGTDSNRVVDFGLSETDHCCDRPDACEELQLPVDDSYVRWLPSGRIHFLGEKFAVSSIGPTLELVRYENETLRPRFSFVSASISQLPCIAKMFFLFCVIQWSRDRLQDPHN